MRVYLLALLFASPGLCSTQEKGPLEDASWARGGDDLKVLKQDCRISQGQCVLDDGGDNGDATEDDETSLLQLREKVGKACGKDDETNLKRHIVEERDIMKQLWSGMDVGQSELFAIRQQVPKRLDSAREKDQSLHKKVKRNIAAPKRLHLLGPPHTGTKLFTETVHLNWPQQMYQACGSPQICDFVVWKHSLSNASDLNRRFKAKITSSSGTANTLYDAQDDDVIVIMTRSPISQMVAWHHQPYSLAPCFGRSFKEAGSPCFSNTSPDWHDVVQGCDVNQHYNKSIEFNSSSDVWNAYYKQYLDMKRSQELGPVLFVSYEELALFPSVVMRQVAKVMEWPIPEHFAIFDGIEADGVSSRNEIVENLTSRSFLKEVTFSERKILCAGLDKSQLVQFYEDPHTAAHISYEFDCSHLSAFGSP